LWYSLFVGLPLFGAFIIGIVTVPIGYRGLRHHQFPPKGHKVYKPTKILKGRKGNIKSVFHLLAPALFIFISIWGYFQVDQMPQQKTEDFDYSLCENI
jgi:hypothetical protein